MSWSFSEILDGVGDVLGFVGDVGKAAGPFIQAGATYGGAQMAADANRDATAAYTAASTQAAQIGADAQLRGAQIAADAQLRGGQMQIDAAREARDYLQGAKERGIGAIRAGTQGYADTIAPLLTERPIMLPAYRNLTTAQQIAREDLLRGARATVAKSGLRGAGRAGVAAIMDQDRRFLADAADRNDADRLAAMRTARTTADTARGSLAQIRAQEGGAIANTEIGSGNTIASNITNAGAAGGQAAAAAGQTQGGALANAGQLQGNALTSAGQVAANSGIANANIWGNAIGSIGSLIAGEESNRVKRLQSNPII